MNSWHRYKRFVGTTIVWEWWKEKRCQCVCCFATGATLHKFAIVVCISLNSLFFSLAVCFFFYFHLIYSAHAKGLFFLMNEKHVICILHGECVYGISSILIVSIRHNSFTLWMSLKQTENAAGACLTHFYWCLSHSLFIFSLCVSWCCNALRAVWMVLVLLWGQND